MANNPLIKSEADERLMMSNLKKCYGDSTCNLGISAEHYRYLAEHVVALRAHIKRIPEMRQLSKHQQEVEDAAGMALDWGMANAIQVATPQRTDGNSRLTIADVPQVDESNVF
jgi:2-oxoglutarate dehydrogenase complex dehydrogenase (E1) component-like enzyme